MWKQCKDCETDMQFLVISLNKLEVTVYLANISVCKQTWHLLNYNHYFIPCTAFNCLADVVNKISTLSSLSEIKLHKVNEPDLWACSCMFLLWKMQIIRVKLYKHHIKTNFWFVNCNMSMSANIGNCSCNYQLHGKQMGAWL